MFAVFAFNAVPLAVAKPSHKVEVTFVKEPLIDVRLAIEPTLANKFVVEAFPDTNKFVEVEFVDVVFVNTPVDGVTFPICVPLIEPPRIVAFAVVRLSEFSVVPLAVAKPNQEVDVT